MKKILVVDDEEDMLKLIESRLIKAKYDVIKASDGIEAIAKAKSKKPDLILLDIMLPGMDGGEVEARLKEDEQTKNIPVVFLSALYTKNDEKNKCNYSGGNVFVAKPFEPEKLLEIIRDQIG
jgi:two-component system sensor histidine kinase/response regulator